MKRATRAGIVAVIATTCILTLAAGLAGATGPYVDEQENYIEECEVYRNHSGYISAYYDYAVFFEQGYEPIELHTYGQPIFLEPPDGVAWDRVYKCNDTDETTTTTVADTTTTTVGESTTTTTIGDTTSTTVADSTTTTVGDSTTTTDPGDSTLPFTGVESDTGLWVIAAFGALGVGGLIVRAARAE